jgi:hypothetical protein
MPQEIVTDDVLRYMETNTIDYIENWRIKESSTLFEYYLKDLVYNDLIAHMLVPSGNTVKMSNGQIVNIPVSEKLFMFPTTKILYDKNEHNEQVIPKLQSLYERGMKFRRSFSVYINGKKIPDAQIYVFASPQGTDLFIPTRFWNAEGLNTLVCTVHDYSDGKYANASLGYHSGNILANIPIPKRLQSSFEKKFLKVYIAGLYIPNDAYTIVNHGTKCDIHLLDASKYGSEYDYEATIDGSIMDSYDNNYLNTSNDLFMYIPKDASALIETAVFLYMCDIYINGYRIPSHDLLQKSYRHFMYKRPLPEEYLAAPYTTQIVVSDKHILAKEFARYIDSFMEYEKWVTDDMAVRQISGDEEPTYDIKPPFVNYATMTFPPNNKYIFDSEITRMMSNYQRALKMIEENSHYFENLLRYYNIEEEEYTVQRDTLGTDFNRTVSILLDNDVVGKHLSATRACELYINDKKIPNDDLFFYTKINADMLKIPITKFPQGETSTVKLYKLHSKNQSQEYCRFIADGSFAHNNIWIKLSDIASISGGLGSYDLNELRVFRQLHPGEGDDGYYYIKQHEGNISFGVVQNQPTNYSLRETMDGNGKVHVEIKIPNTSPIRLDDIVYIVNPKFHSSKSFVVSDNNDTINNESRLILNNVVGGEIIPKFIGEYLTKLFVNGKIFVPNIDYFILDPEKNVNLSSTIVIFRKQINPGDVVEIVHTGIRNKFLCGYLDIPVENKYGFIFLSTLPIPFSLDYIDMYINDTKLTKDNVVIYSDRLIRIKGIELPFRNVALFTRFRIPFDWFYPYMEQYASTGSLFDIYIKEFCRQVIYDDISDPVNPDVPKIDDVFEDNQVNGGATPPEPAPVNPNPPPIEIIDPFLDRFGRDMMSGQNMVSKYFDANEYKLIDFDEYLILLSDDQKASQAINFNANAKEHIREDFDFNPNAQYRSLPEIYKVIADTFISGAILIPMDSNTTLVPYVDPLIETYLYPSDVLPIDSNRIFKEDELTEDVVLDSNIIDMEE